VAASVRRASAQDAEGCARVHVVSWQAGYDGLLPAAYLEAMTVADRLPWWEQQLGEAGDPTFEVFVADGGGGVLGFAAAVPSRTDVDVGVLAQLYVDPAAWGTGVAPDLLAAATDSLRARGLGAATLSVARENARARRFYEREGWRATGAEELERLWGVELVAAVYRREL
jgi:ribosomal protein S18 acetylase RimI-like enzyme